MRLAIFALALVAAMLPRGQRPTDQAAPPPTRAWDERRIDLPIIGTSTAYIPRTATSHVVLFLSGDGGWNLGVVDMARRMAADSVVVGISLPALVRQANRLGGCWYPAGDLETLAHAAEKRLRITEYRAPVLVGYSSGATLVYAALAPAPPATFAGGISLGFCADLDVARPVCRSTGWSPEYDARKHLSWLPRVPQLLRPWYVLQGIQDQVCAPADTRRFTEGMANAHYVEIAGTGHGFGRPVRWGAPFDAALAAIWKAASPPPRPKPQSVTLAATEARLDKLGLPLEYRWPAREPMAYLVFFSGDGGWASLDEAVASDLAARGIGVIGLSSLRYFWRAKTRAEVAGVLRSLVAAVGRPVFIGGYSFGAEVVAVSLQAWTPGERAAVSGLVLVGPSVSATFEIDPLDWVRTPGENAAARVAPAVEGLMVPTLCITGAEEEDSGCRALPNKPPIRVETMPGSHHFGGNYAALADRIVSFIEAEDASRSGIATQPRGVAELPGVVR